jgi:hypothetical protein
LTVLFLFLFYFLFIFYFFLAQQHRQATFALQSQLDACKFELLQTNTELTFARQILLQRVTSDQEIMNDDESSAELESLVENTDLMRRVYERNTISSEDDTIKQLPVRMQRQLKANEELREAQQLLGELAHNTLRSANGANSKRKQTESMSALSLSDPSEHVSFVQLQNALKFAAKYVQFSFVFFDVLEVYLVFNLVLCVCGQGADGAEKLRVDFSSRLFSAHQELTRIRSAVFFQVFETYQFFKFNFEIFFCSSTTKPEPESNRSTLSESRIAKSIPLTSALLQIQSHKPATLESLQQLLDASHKEHQAEHELWTDRINSLEASVASAQLSVACLKQECEAERSMRNEVVQQVRDSQEKAENVLF